MFILVNKIQGNRSRFYRWWGDFFHSEASVISRLWGQNYLV